MKPIIFASILAALGIAVGVAYSSSLGNDFVWDDRNFIVESPAIHGLSRSGEAFVHNIGYSGGARNNLYRPLVEVLNSVDYAAGGGKPLPFHITNIFLHWLAASLAFLFLYIVCGNLFVSASAALIFAVHPIQTESVTYISGRADPLYSVFTLLSLSLFAACIGKTGKSAVIAGSEGAKQSSHSYDCFGRRLPTSEAKGPRNDGSRNGLKLCLYSLSLIALALALISKEAAIITPFLAWMYCVTVEGGRSCHSGCVAMEKSAIEKSRHCEEDGVRRYDDEAIFSRARFLLLLKRLLRSPDKSPGSLAMTRKLPLRHSLNDSVMRDLFALAGLFAVTAAYIVMRLTILDFSKIAVKTLDVPLQPLYIRALTAAKAIFLYFRFIFFPVGFQMEIHLPDARSIMESNVFAAVLGILAIIGLLIYLKRKDKYIFFGMAWYFLCLAAVLNIFPVNAKAAVHWLYLPSIGLFFALCMAIWRIVKENKVIFTAIILLFAILLGARTFAKNREWKNEESLYLSILPSSQTPRVYINLGNIFARKNELDKAAHFYLMALKIAPGQTEGYVNLGYIYNAQKKYSEAEAMLKRALELSPRHANAHLNLSVVYANTGRLDEALGHAQKAVEYNPSQPMAYSVMGQALSRLGRNEEASKAIERYKELTTSK